MPHILVTRAIPDEGLNMLRDKGYKLTIHDADKPMSKAAIIRELKTQKYDGLLCLLTDEIDARVMDAGLPKLKVIANYAVGFNNIDVDAAKERNLPISNTPGEEISESVAEHVVALMFGLAHNVVKGDAFARAGKYKGWGPQMMLGTDVYGKTLGVIGLGRIGQALVERAVKGFKMKVLYTDPDKNKAFEKKYGAKRVTQETLLKKSDFISLHVPLLESTRHLISAKQLKLMKDSAYLINTSRGPVVDELALVKALTKNEIAGAALDVFECEPLIDCNPKDTYELRKLDNVILTPHIASATNETRQAMSRRAAKNIIAVLSGKKAPNAVT